MKNICVITSTRADFGILKPLIVRLENDDFFNMTLLATGTHLLSEYGNTIDEIDELQLKNVHKLNVEIDSANTKHVLGTMINFFDAYSNYFEKNKFDLAIVLGDRYEVFCACVVLSMYKIPIAHLHGGETTIGATDEFFRHSITKMSYLHFTASEEYKNRVIQLGENPDRVFNVGSLGVENILNMQLFSKEQVYAYLEIPKEKKYILVTFHPVTMDDDEKCTEEIDELFSAIKQMNDIFFIITKSNADSGGTFINEKIESFIKQVSNAKAYCSLGHKKYLSAMKYCDAVMGNSSSGIIEAPAFCVPTINIGDRQKGRLQAKSIINCNANADDIISAIHYSLSPNFRKGLENSVNLFGDGYTGEKIIAEIKNSFNSGIDLKKTFYDIK